MPTKTGKPITGERILFDFIVLGERRQTWRGTVVRWPRYGSVRVQVDEVLFDPRGIAKVGHVADFDEYTAAMYLSNGTVKVQPQPSGGG